jgi:hypothetical protein
LSDKPLHVRVAEALGCKPAEYDVVFGPNAWACQCPGSNKGEAHGDLLSVYRYDTDWSVTGPLVELLGVTLEHYGGKWMAWGEDYVCTNSGEHEGTSSWDGEECWFTSPLVAVCKLILALHERGKLPKNGR